MNRTSAEMTRFLVVGVGSNLLNFVVYVLTHAVIGAPLIVASTAGYLAGILNSYHFGRIWVFDAADRTDNLTIAFFFLVYAIGGLGMSGIIDALDRYAGLDYRICWFFGAIFAFLNNFFGSKWLVFKGNATRDDN